MDFKLDAERKLSTRKEPASMRVKSAAHPTRMLLLRRMANFTAPGVVEDARMAVMSNDLLVTVFIVQLQCDDQ
jgi:hypothetical protein